jgi:hypothetical protein
VVVIMPIEHLVIWIIVGGIAGLLAGAGVKGIKVSPISANCLGNLLEREMLCLL